MFLKEKIHKKHTLSGLRKKYLTPRRRCLHWFIALTDDPNPDLHYDDMAKVALHTALKRTRLIPHLIYDGRPSELTDWCASHGVEVHYRRTPLYDDLNRFQELRRIKDPREDNMLRIGAGAFLRLEIPDLLTELGIEHETALYTDVDVMFLADPCDLLCTMRPQTFAVATEMEDGGMNSGVMLMNVRDLRKTAREFLDFTRSHLGQFIYKGWDQDAYVHYYRRNWEHFPIVYNWKPYWGWNDDAKIIHFHGPKPAQRAAIEAGTASALLTDLANAPTSAYHAYSDLWDRALNELKPSG